MIKKMNDNVSVVCHRWWVAGGVEATEWVDIYCRRDFKLISSKPKEGGLIIITII
jgi:hypothetical protein